MKTAGRESGKYCVVINKADPGFVLITGPKSLTKVKRRKCNIHHLEPLVEKVKIKADASDEEVLKVLKDEKIFENLGFKVVTKDAPVQEKPKAVKKVEHKEEKPKVKKSEPKKVEKKPKKAAKKPAKKESKPVKKAKAKKAAKKK